MRPHLAREGACRHIDLAEGKEAVDRQCANFLIFNHGNILLKVPWGPRGSARAGEPRGLLGGSKDDASEAQGMSQAKHQRRQEKWELARGSPWKGQRLPRGQSEGECEIFKLFKAESPAGRGGARL